MESSIRQRIVYVLKLKRLNVFAASEVLDIPQRTLNRQLNEDGNISLSVVVALLQHFPDISSRWLLLGTGSFFTGDSQGEWEMAYDKRDLGAPFYNDLPVSAGCLGMAMVDTKERAKDFCMIPHVKAQFFFPIMGCSMEPEIYEGDIVGVVCVDNLNDVNNDSIYMIVTRDDRMIKRLCRDMTDDSILWCESQNYPRFSVRKEDVLHLFRVVFHGANR